MSILDNTASLQALLEQANDLSVDGGGGGAEVKWVTGTITLSAGTKSNGTVIKSVMGLGFKPTHVIIYLKTDFSMSSTSYFGLTFIQYGLANTSVCVKKYSTSSTYAYSYTGSAHANLSVTSDGFFLSSLNSNLYTGSSYGYIAIYDSSYSNVDDDGDSGSGDDDDLPGGPGTIS